MADGTPKLGEEPSDVKKDKINAIWAQLNSKTMTSPVGHNGGVPAFGVASKSPRSTEGALKSKAVPGWMVNLGIAPKRPRSETDSGAMTNQPLSIEDILNKKEMITLESNIEKQEFISATGSTSNVENQEDAFKDIEKEDARKIAAAALASAKAATKASTDGKMEINEVRDFAGEEVRITKFVDPNSKAAVAARKRAEMQAASSSGLDALLQQIGKKQKLNILDKSRKDWGEFKEDQGIEVELEMHKKSGDTYTEKVAFLQRADVREYERERDARLALQNKRRNESGTLD